MGEIKLEIQGKEVEEREEARVGRRVGNGIHFGSEKVRIRVDEDRISSLPDEIIHHILSFNDTKFAVQTSVLSSRWKFIWKSLPYLKFNTSSFRILPTFSKFVNRVLSFRNNKTEVTSVDLCYRGPAGQKFVEKIVSYAMSHNVQNVEIFAHYPYPSKADPQFPFCLFSSESLKHLKMKSINIMCDLHVFPLPQFPWNFPSLTTLCLEDIWLCDDNTKSLELFSKCVNLKNLTLKNCGARSLEAMTIITPQLENLSIKSWGISRFVVSAPNLSSFYYHSGHHKLVLSAGNLQFLYTVNLQWIVDVPESKEKRQKLAKKLFTLFEELRSAKFLTLHSHIIEVLATVPDLLETQPSPFNNLKCLEVKGFENQKTTSPNSANHVIRYLLNSSPTAAVIMQLPQEQPKKPRKRVKLKASRDCIVSIGKQLDTAKERLIADSEALSKGHIIEREALIARHKAEIEASRELIKGENYGLKTKVSSQTSMAPTFQGQPQMNSSCTTAGHVATSKQEEPMKDLQAWMDGAAIYRGLNENMDAMNERQMSEREALSERHKAERKAMCERHLSGLDVLSAQLAELQEQRFQC